MVYCRCTPSQKAQIVKILRSELNQMTLAIGDGANDCNMIKEANVGIGIFGNTNKFYNFKVTKGIKLFKHQILE